VKYALQMSEQNKFSKLLSDGRPVVLDGGFATQLEAQGCDINNPLWSASIISGDPQAIVDAHRAYLDAGAQIIISASYQTIDPELIAGAINLAVQARDEYVLDNPGTNAPLVAGSIGPYGAVLSDGSEYTGDYGVSHADLLEFHRSRVAQLDASAADILACETIPSYDEALALRDLLADASSPAWISFSCRDGSCINDGTTIETAVGLFRGHPNVRAVGVNCSAPQHIASLIQKIRATLPDMPILVYPNSGEVFNADDKTWSGTATASDWVPAAQAWLAAGATLVGGCCRTGPQHIHAIRQTISRSLE
jgi:homocysteine S-methyltransferase